MSERWRSGLVLLLSVVLLGAVLVVGPGSRMDALRRTLGLGGDRLGTPAEVRPGGVHAFLQHQPGDPDTPVAWDPCREISYEINPDGGPDDAEELVQEAVAEVASVTGLRFDYEGTTDRRPEWDEVFVPSIGQRQPVLVSWATEDEVEQLEGDVAGVGGAVAVPVDPGGWLRYVSGGVTLDEVDYALLESQPEGSGYQRAILLHELGHLVGLGHVDSEEELMFSDNVGLQEFGIGDLNGLVRLGEGRCA